VEEEEEEDCGRTTRSPASSLRGRRASFLRRNGRVRAKIRPRRRSGEENSLNLFYIFLPLFSLCEGLIGLSRVTPLGPGRPSPPAPPAPFSSSVRHSTRTNGGGRRSFAREKKSSDQIREMVSFCILGSIKCLTCVLALTWLINNCVPLKNEYNI